MGKLGELVLELTDWCPLQCRHCSSQSGPDRQDHLPKDVALRVIEEASVLGADKVSFGGGEPTASPIFADALARVVALEMLGEVYTCGVWSDREQLGPLPARMIADIACLSRVKVIFSVHAANAPLHDYLTEVVGSLNWLEQSLNSCLAAGIECEINFVPLRPNAGTFTEVVRFAERKGVKRLSVLRFVPQGRGWPNRSELELSHEEEHAFLAELARLRSATPIDIRTGSPFNGLIPGNAVPCRAGSAKLVVQADGNVLPCEVFKHRERRDWGLCVHSFSLREILGSQQIAAVGAEILSGQCIVCPVHGGLRQQGKGGHSHGVPEAAVQTQ